MMTQSVQESNEILSCSNKDTAIAVLFSSSPFNLVQKEEKKRKKELDDGSRGQSVFQPRAAS
jgi:hypothetical protein